MQSKRTRWLLAATILGFMWLMPAVVIGQDASPAAPSCRSKCRGLGLDKVKAGDEHCGLVSRERKRTALDAACTLADSKREELQVLAQERAESRCGHIGEREGCRCEGELRRWENVYTNHLSGRCWSECGWAYLIECKRESEVDRAEGGPAPSH